MQRSGWAGVAGLLGAVGVAMGAFAAHALQGNAQAAGWDDTGARFLLIHAVLLVVLAGDGRWLWPRRLVLAGSILFCGSLFALALGAPIRAAMAAPVGGSLLILGWLALAVVALRDRAPAASG